MVSYVDLLIIDIKYEYVRLYNLNTNNITLIIIITRFVTKHSNQYD